MSELENALRQGGEKVTQGRIRVDSTRALSRLRDFRFAEPAHWVLEVVRAATLSHAKKLTVRSDADDVEVSFDGEPMPTELMKHLLEQALNDSRTPDEKRTRLLALGVAGALGMNARFVTVASGGVELTLRGDQVEVKEARSRGTRLHLQKAFGWRVATAFFKGSPEALALQQRAYRFPGELLLNGKDLSRASPFTTATRVRRVVQGAGFRLEVALPEGPPREQTTLDLDVAGVVVTTRALTLPGLQLEAWLRADEVRRNASGSDVVENDALFDEAVLALRRVSLTLLGEKVQKLVQEPAWRAHFGRALQYENRSLLDDRARELLEKTPLLPGPSGERYTVREIRARGGKTAPLYVAHQAWPEGSYPTPCVLLGKEPELDKLLPNNVRVDVAPLVQRRKEAVLARKRHEKQQVEEAKLPDKEWLARGPIAAKDVTGEVGFAASGHGAFVRVLHFGKLLVSGELTALSPLRFRAVVDWRRPLGDELFEPGAEAEVFSRVQKAVEAAAVKVLCDALPDPRLSDHALELLHRLVCIEEKPRGELPKVLLDTPLFPAFEGERQPLATLFGHHTWRYVLATPSAPLLDGSLLLVLTSLHREVLAKLAPKKLEDATQQLRDEAQVRLRLAGARRAPELDGTQVKVPLRSAHFHGELGVPKVPVARLTLTLLKSGIELETTELSPRYHHAVAIVESEQFSPNARWTSVTRDEHFRALVNALHEAQRELIVPLLAVPRDAWSAGADLFLAAALKRELRSFDLGQLDPVQRQLALTPLFQTGQGRQSLVELQAQLMQSGRLLVLPDLEPRPHVPEGFHVLFERPGIAGALGEALNTTLEDGTKALAEATLRETLRAQPKVPRELPPDVALQVELADGHFSLLAGLDPGVSALAQVQVTLEGRPYTRLTLGAPLPLRVLFDAPSFEPNVERVLSEGQQAQVKTFVERAVHAVLKEALRTKEEPAAERALLLALARGLDATAPQALSEALRARRVFPCTDGEKRSVEQLGGESPQYVREAREGLLPNKRPIVRAHDPLVRLALGRWPTAVQVDQALEVQRAALEAREALERHDEIRCSVASPWRQRIDEQGVSGEVVIAHQGAGRLELYLDHKPLCTLPHDLPVPLAAALDSPHLTATPDFAGVVRDEQLAKAVELVRASAERLAVKLASERPEEPWATPLARLAFFVAEATAWHWKAQRPAKKKGKKKAQAQAPVEPEHPLVSAPVLRASDGAALSLASLIALQRQEGGVDVVTRGGQFLDPQRRAWWPRPDEAEAAKKLGLVLRDVSEVLERDESIRRRPRFQGELVAPIASSWREPVTGAGLEGEVALPRFSEGRLVIEVLRERLLLERYETTHPVGGIARVESPALSPTDDWNGARRDAAFKSLVVATEAALERLLLRRVEAGDPDAWSWSLRALQWRLGTGGPLAEVLPRLTLLRDVHGDPVSVGAALELGRTRGRVPVAARRARADGLDTLVLLSDEANGRVLDALDLKSEDVTDDLRKAKELERSLTRRRLAELKVARGLVTRKVATDVLTGELALSLSPAAGEVTLARDGIAVGPLKDVAGGVIGVLDVKELRVSEDWTSATPTHAQRDRIEEEIDALFALLAAKAADFGEREGELATRWALEYLQEAGVRSPTQLDRLEGTAAALADAPFFLTLEGERVTLRAVAAEVVARGRVAVLARGARVRAREQLVLTALNLTEPWLDALAQLFGGASKVWRISDTAEWEREVREADPQEGTPELAALRFLRKELKLLRAGALGSLTPDDLEELKLERAGGKTPLRYDRKRKLILLDPAHPDIARTLAEPQTRPERLWVLLVAIFGLINRELHHVTDEHEVKLLMALAGHLAANPKALT